MVAYLIDGSSYYYSMIFGFEQYTFNSRMYLDLSISIIFVLFLNKIPIKLK